MFEKFEKDLRAKARETKKHRLLQEKLKKKAVSEGQDPNTIKRQMSFKAKAGKRLVDMGVMSDETESDEDQYEERKQTAESAMRKMKRALKGQVTTEMSKEDALK